jgi:hypothetical protein
MRYLDTETVREKYGDSIPDELSHALREIEKLRETLSNMDSVVAAAIDFDSALDYGWSTGSRNDTKRSRLKNAILKFKELEIE